MSTGTVTSALRKSGLLIGKRSVSSIVNREGFTTRAHNDAVRIDYVSGNIGRMSNEQNIAYLNGARTMLAKLGIAAVLHNFNSDQFPMWGLLVS